MRRPVDDITDVRIPPESLARWALEAPAVAQEATWSALCFLVEVEHASTTQLPVPAVLRREKAALDPDGFLRVPRGALEQFRARAARAMGWMEQLLFFRERFPTPAQRNAPDAVYSLAQLFGARASASDAAVDVLVRESILPEIEDILYRTVTYPGLRLLMERLRETDSQRSHEARRLAGEVLGDLTSSSVWIVRKRLVSTATRAVLGARALLDELERGGMKVDRGRAARGFARRLEEAVSGLSGVRVLPEALIARLAGKVQEKAPENVTRIDP
ncbi:MAG TPA: hypothetical protein VG496_05585 [Myxococcales bacterium]|nr:hypothetical protein [Myxococcales bacterium]